MMRETLAATLDLMALGGPVVALLAALSVLGLAIVLLKAWQLMRLGGGRGRVEAALAAWSRGDADAAGGKVENVAHPAARVVAGAMAALAGGAPEALAREEAARLAEAELQRLRAHLRGLEAIATLAPLLGLLGTVLGMIAAFRVLQQAGGAADPATLAGGIWEALLTTAVGLAVAIPAAAALGLFDSAVERQRHLMEDALTRVFTRARGGGDAP